MWEGGEDGGTLGGCGLQSAERGRREMEEKAASEKRSGEGHSILPPSLVWRRRTTDSHRTTTISTVAGSSSKPD